MRGFLRLNSLVFGICVILLSLACGTEAYAQRQSSVGAFEFQEGKARYNVIIDAGKIQLTGICMMKETDSSVVGSMMNEFGIKAFDFTYDKQTHRIKFLNIQPLMDHWYIKRVMKNDWRFMLNDEILGAANLEKTKQPVRGRELKQEPDNTWSMSNAKGMKYRFKQLMQH